MWLTLLTYNWTDEAVNLISREWPGPLYVFLYLALSDKSLDTPALHDVFINQLCNTLKCEHCYCLCGFKGHDNQESVWPQETLPVGLSVKRLTLGHSALDKQMVLLVKD